MSRGGLVVLAVVCLAAEARAQPGMTAPTLPPAPLFERRVSDERLFLTPTPLAMRPGAVSISDDAGVSVRVAFGVSRRLQLDARIGGLLIPGAVGGVLPLPGGLAAGGGAGVALIGLIDLGAKVVILDETASVPGVALSYDMVDIFGVAAGGAGIVLVGSGAAGAGIVAVGGANLQFNLFSVSAGKHLGWRSQVTAGSYILDNHHYLPQSAAFASACGAGGAGGAGSGGKVEACGGGSAMIDRVPVQIQPFIGVERAVGKHSSFAGEILFSRHFGNTIGTTGYRWNVWGQGAFNVRLDLALLWTNRGYPLPWLGAGLHFR